MEKAWRYHPNRAMKLSINIIGSETLGLHSTPLGNALGRAHCFWCIPAKKIWLESNREETSDISKLGDILQSSWTHSSKVEGHSKKKTWRTQICSDQGDQVPACNVRSQTGPQPRKKGTSGTTDELHRRFYRLGPSSFLVSILVLWLDKTLA